MFPYEWDGAEPVNEDPLNPPVPLAVDPAFCPASVDSDFEQLSFI